MNVDQAALSDFDNAEGECQVTNRLLETVATPFEETVKDAIQPEIGYVDLQKKSALNGLIDDRYS